MKEKVKKGFLKSFKNLNLKGKEVKNMKKLGLILAVLTVLSVLGFAINAQAVPIGLPYEPVYFQFNNIEQVDQSLANNITVPGGYGVAGNWGLVNVSIIQHGAVSIPHVDIAGGPGWWMDDGPGGANGQITGIFYGINLTTGTTATGGTLDLYYQEAGSDPITAAILAGTSGGPDAATVGLFTGGTFLARLNFASGILDGDNVTTISSNVNLTTSLSGLADSFADVNTSVVGPWTNTLNADWFWVDTDGDGIRGEVGETRDLRFSNFFNGLPAWDGSGSIKGLRSNDPGRVYTTPEPCSMLLVGSGLIGLATVVRRKFKR